MAAEAGFDVQLQAMEFASSLQARCAATIEAYLIGWSGRVDVDGNTYQFLHSGQGNNNGPLPARRWTSCSTKARAA